MSLRENIRGLWSKIREGAGRRPATRSAIVFDAEGVRIEREGKGGGREAGPRALWREVARVAAYKRDLFACDLMCVLLARGDGSALEVDEEMDGWTELLAALPTHLPGCQPETAWYFEVMLPPFETRYREIFNRVQP